jgi:hypothetical protein
MKNPNEFTIKGLIQVSKTFISPWKQYMADKYIVCCNRLINILLFCVSIFRVAKKI